MSICIIHERERSASDYGSAKLHHSGTDSHPVHKETPYNPSALWCSHIKTRRKVLETKRGVRDENGEGKGLVSKDLRQDLDGGYCHPVHKETPCHPSAL